MRRVFLCAAFVMACNELKQPEEPQQSVPLARLDTANASVRVPNSYIVVLNTKERSAKTSTQRLGITPKQSYEPVRGTPAGFAATLTPAQLDQVRRSPSVAWVEEDRVVRAQLTQSVSPGGGLWGLDRIDQGTLPLSGTYTYSANGTGVNAYIIDSGIRTSHYEFSIYGVSRAAMVYDAYAGTLPTGDCYGHGTHVAGTVGGKTYGVAKRVHLFGVRVLDCSGAGTLSTIIGAMAWVLENFQAPAVANLSFGGSGISQLENLYVDAMAQAGLFPVVAAGNEGENVSSVNSFSCYSSPAGATYAFTVAASTKSDARATFSDWGRCIRLYAPGEGIQSAYYLSNTSTVVLDGTSMAAPHVTGVVALLLQRHPTYTWNQIASALLSKAVPDVVTGNDPWSDFYGTPNLLLQKGAW